MITNLNHITLAVRNIETSFAFYRDVLGLRPLVLWDRGAYFLVGDEKEGFWFCLNVDAKREANPCYTHYAFSVNPEQFEIMVKKISDSGTVIFKENTSLGDSLYFLDPDGHKLEIHVGDWRSRIAAKKADLGNWKNIEFFV